MRSPDGGRADARAVEWDSLLAAVADLPALLTEELRCPPLGTWPHAVDVFNYTISNVYDSQTDETSWSRSTGHQDARMILAPYCPIMFNRGRIDGRDIRAWISGSLDREADEGLVLAWPGQVRALVQGGHLMAFPSGPMAVALTELNVMVASPDLVLPIPWYLVRACNLTDGRLAMSWLSPVLGSAIDSMEVELDQRYRRQTTQFRPLIAALVERTRAEALYPAQVQALDDLATVIYQRDAGELPMSDAQTKIDRVLKDFESAELGPVIPIEDPEPVTAARVSVARRKRR